MNKHYSLGIDVGGSHLTAAIVDVQNRKIVENSKVRTPIDSRGAMMPVLRAIVGCIEKCLQNFHDPILGIGVSMPGPFDYDRGISKILKCNKYDSIFGVDLRQYLWSNLSDYIDRPTDIIFMNDASCFLLGEALIKGLNSGNIVGITLGTGFGSGFMAAGKVVSTGEKVPGNGQVFDYPFKGKRAEDWLGTQWFLDKYKQIFGQEINNVKLIAEKALDSQIAKNIFDEFGDNLGEFLTPILADFETSHLILGGNVTKSFELFRTSFAARLDSNLPVVLVANNAENSAILGVALEQISRTQNTGRKRKTLQPLMPIVADSTPSTTYDIYPDFHISKGDIFQGYKSLAKEISKYKNVVIDGYIGVYWNDFMSALIKELKLIGSNPVTWSVIAALKDVDTIGRIVEPYLGGDDAVFGRLCPFNLENLFDKEKFDAIKGNSDNLNILYGPGAALAGWNAKLINIDVPKNEIQYRSRSGHIFNLGMDEVLPPKPQYKRMFYVDWPLLNRHKNSILKSVDYFVDGQFLGDITWASGKTVRNGMKEILRNAFRPRPWFSPGVWGGDWIKQKFEDLTQDVVNYAWSFELIAPENGIVLSANGTRLEISFDMLQYYDNISMLGAAAETFGTDFPIRFDYLDTFNGTNLSLQCHPTPEYIRKNFSERFTQDETYYILDAAPDAEVYLGFKEGVDKEEFHGALVMSNEESKAIDVSNFVQVLPARKHDLFLIPHGTIHCSGKNNLVLEISSTPYIYTFKMYDWMRFDLDGQPRPLNIERGMENVNFDCQGDKVVDEYISKERVLEKGDDWQTLLLPTHQKHFYEIHRFEFSNRIEVKTKNQCHILNLVEGSQIKIITGQRSIIINFAETFVVPSAAGEYTMINLGNEIAKVIQSNVKPDFCDTRF